MVEEGEASVQLLKTFAPLDGLKRENVAALAKKVTVRTMSAGRTLFKEGETDKRTVWLVAGMLEIREGDRTVAMIRGGTPEARSPLYPQLPRRVTARAMGAAGDRDGRPPRRRTGRGGIGIARRGVAATGPRHAGGIVGRLAVFPARLGVAGQPAAQHVHADRARHRGRLSLQRRCRPG